MKNKYSWLALLLVTIFIAACDKREPIAPDNVVFTLYTNAPSDPFFRNGIATFEHYVKGFEEVDAAVNQKRCNEAAAMFQAKWEQGTKGYTNADRVKHWCEKGRFKE